MEIHDLSASLKRCLIRSLVFSPRDVSRALPFPHRALLFIYEVAAAILLPTGFVGFGAERFLLAVADGLDAIATNSGLHEGILDCVRTVGAESEVVLGGAALVAVSFDRDADIRMLLQELS